MVRSCRNIRTLVQRVRLRVRIKKIPSLTELTFIVTTTCVVCATILTPVSGRITLDPILYDFSLYIYEKPEHIETLLLWCSFWLLGFSFILL